MLNLHGEYAQYGHKVSFHKGFIKTNSYEGMKHFKPLKQFYFFSKGCDIFIFVEWKRLFILAKWKSGKLFRLRFRVAFSVVKMIVDKFRTIPEWNTNNCSSLDIVAPHAWMDANDRIAK